MYKLTGAQKAFVFVIGTFFVIGMLFVMSAFENQKHQNAVFMQFFGANPTDREEVQFVVFRKLDEAEKKIWRREDRIQFFKKAESGLSELDTEELIEAEFRAIEQEIKILEEARKSAEYFGYEVNAQPILPTRKVERDEK